LGETNNNTKPVALSGRVPVRVHSRGGPIKPGDPITTSSMPGVGIKATQPGRIIGTALESWTGEGEGKILVLINLGYYIGEENDTALLVQPEEMVIEPTLGNLDQLAESTTSGGLKLADIIATDSAMATSSSQISLVPATIISRLVEFTNGIRVKTIFENLGQSLFQGPAVFFAKVDFRKIVQFIDQVTFQKDVSFKGKVEFNQDAAGYAIVKQGQRFVDVVFENEYTTEPIVNASLIIPKLNNKTFEEKIISGDCVAGQTIEMCQEEIAKNLLKNNIQYAIVGKSKQGFMIVLKELATQDILFSWNAVSVSEAKTSQGSSMPDILGENTTATKSAQLEEGNSPTIFPSISPAITAVSPTSFPKATPTLSPSPTITMTPSPTAIPQSENKMTVLPNELGFVRLREGPSSNSAEIGQITSRTVIDYTDIQYGWYQVHYEDKTGWVSSTYLGPTESNSSGSP